MINDGNINILNIPDFKDYLNPISYTSEEEYMTMYIEAKIHYFFGLSFTAFLETPIDRMMSMYSIGKRESEKQNTSMQGITNQLGELSNGL